MASDLLFGHVSSRDAGIIGAVRDWRQWPGNPPFETWLVHRGMKLSRSAIRACALMRFGRTAERASEGRIGSISGSLRIRRMRSPPR
jgi:hypothetical protein